MTHADRQNQPLKSPVTGYLLPVALRNFVRNRETGVVMVAIVIGVLSGLLVAIIAALSELTHSLLFGIPFDARLSATGTISWQRTLLIPICGGVVLALLAWIVGNRLKAQMADAIEANALLGGRVSMRGSLLISIQTLLSNGFGGSVGLEAGYTQICAAFSSYFGRKLAARRSDMRLLVACGAAGAISAAFSAPLAGSFYAFEVVLGTYTAANLVPVVASAVSAWLIARHLNEQSFLLIAGHPTPVSVEMIGQCVLIGVICAFASILLMLAIAAADRTFQHLRFLKGMLRPVIGGGLLGAMALLTPTVLGAGHGAMQLLLLSHPTWLLLATTILLKTMASAVSLGSGFRGGLFFASLLLGALIGMLYSTVAGIPFPELALQPGTAAIAALAALGTGVIGAPFSMICLALEITGEFSVTVGAIVASSVTALIVRELFGYSFATWRFHLRGEVIRGPQDVGWIKQFNAATLMRSDFETASGQMPIAEAQKLFQPGRLKQIVLRDPKGGYAGVVSLAELHSVDIASDTPIETLAHQQTEFLRPAMTIRDIMAAFEKTETDVLVVVDNSEDRTVIGTVSETHALRTYGEELERRNQEMFFR
jgi:CIC family chloride channel protein